MTRFFATLFWLVLMASQAMAGGTFLEQRLADGIPDNFDDLIFKLSDHTRPAEGMPLLAIPMGRSLVKNQTSFANPRILPVSIQTPEVFLGFSMATKQAEVISWNQSQGIYEFFIIDSIEKGMQAHVTKPNRALCLSCHQNGGPIFSRSPWSEALGSDTVDNGPQYFFGSLNWEANPFHRHPILTDGQDLFGYDNAIRTANHRLQARRVCDQVCSPQDVQCRLRLLSAMLEIDTDGRGESNSVDYFLKNLWPRIAAKGYPQISSVLPDRDPFDDNIPEGVTLFVRGDSTDDNGQIFHNGRINYAEDVSGRRLVKLGISHGEKDRIIGITKEADPTFPRPAFRFSQGNAREDLVRLRDYCIRGDFDKKPRAFRNVFEHLQKNPYTPLLLKDWPPSRDQVIGVLNQTPEVRAEYVNLHHALQAQALKAPIQLPSAPPLHASQSESDSKFDSKIESDLEPTHIFTKHCSECHSGDGALISGYPLPLNDLQKMRTYGNGLALKYLTEPKGSPKMPPKEATFPLSDREREILIKSLGL